MEAEKKGYWAEVYKEGGSSYRAFRPVLNAKIESFDGGCGVFEEDGDPKEGITCIKNLRITSAVNYTVEESDVRACAGLFAAFEGTKAFDVYMDGVTIAVSDEKDVAAGAFAGRMAGTAVPVVKSCYLRNINIQVQTKDEAGFFGAAGALAGMCHKGGRFFDCSVIHTAAAPSGPVINARESGSTAGTISSGGLLGYVKGDLYVEKSFAAVILTSGSNADTVASGGLVGTFEAASGSDGVMMYDSYADCYLSGKTVGGLLGGGRRKGLLVSCPLRTAIRQVSLPRMLQWQPVLRRVKQM